jgi:glycosyltransferase involved in cell wall biosynthesis
VSLVSVVVPVWNGRCYLSEAIESILAQDGIDLDIWIVDDGSTDGSADLAEQIATRAALPIHVIRQMNGGAAAARNTGARHSQGRFLAFLDADDVWTPGRLDIMLAAFSEPDSPDAVFGHVEQFLSPDVADLMANSVRIPAEPMPGYHAGGMLVTRAAFELLAGFNEAFRQGEMLDWVARFREAGQRERLIPEVVFRRRIHNTNMMLSPSAAMDYTQVLRAALERRRKAAR